MRNLASRGLVDHEFVEGRRADDDTLQGRLNALFARRGDAVGRREGLGLG